MTGGAIGDIPTIHMVKELGLEVYTSGNRPHDPGHEIANNYIKADYTSSTELVKLVHNLKINFIVPSAHDTAYVAAANVAKICKLPGFDKPKIARMIHQKDKLALGILKAGLPGIKTQVIKDYASTLNLFHQCGRKLVIKPADMTGGRGVSFVDNVKDLKSAIELAEESSLSRKVLAQEYLEGSEHGFTAIIKNQEVVFAFFDDEYRYLNRFRVAGTFTPSSIDNNSKSHLTNWIDSFSAFYGLIDGLIHVQFIQLASGPKVLEVCRRPPGDLYPYFVEATTSFPYIKNFVLGFMGLPISSPDGQETLEEITLRHVVLADKNGIYRGLSISNSIQQNITLSYVYKKPGEIVTNYLTETLAVFILKIPPNLKEEIVANIHKHLHPIIEVS